MAAWCIALNLLLLIPAYVCEAHRSNFTVLHVQLPIQVGSIGYGVYQNNLIFFNGDKPDLTANEQQYALSLFPLSSHWSSIQLSTTSYIEYGGTNVVQINNLVYGLPSPRTPDETPMFIYDLRSASYINQSLLPSQITYLIETCVATEASTIYVIGGLAEKVVNYTLIYDIYDDKWSFAAEINVARSAAGCSFDAMKKYLYLFGGAQRLNEYNITNSIEQYNVERDEWKVLRVTLPYAVSSSNCVLYPSDDNIWCIGGDTPEITDYVQIFNPVKQTFDVQHLAFATTDTPVVVYNDSCVIVFGGYTKPNLEQKIQTMNCDF